MSNKRKIHPAFILVADDYCSLVKWKMCSRIRFDINSTSIKYRTITYVNDHFSSFFNRTDAGYLSIILRNSRK